MVENVSQTMESDMVKYLKHLKAITCDNVIWWWSWKVLFFFCSHLGLYSNLICIVLVFVGCESSGSPKGLEVLAKGLEYALLTSDHRTCCQNLSKYRYRNNLFTCFLILSNEIIDNQIDNVAITKNCQKGPWAARDPIHPWSGALQFFASVSWNIYLGGPAAALKPTIGYIINIISLM